MPLDFTAIDFETANSSSASACSVGLVKVRSGKVVDKVAWFIRPPAGHDTFNEWNTRIHGIVPSDVAAAATWAAQMPDLLSFADGDHFVAHNAGFDMGVIAGGCRATGLTVPDLSYLCSLVVARKTYNLDSYKLPVAAMAAGFEDFAHHDALADSEACAAIIIHAASRHGADSLEELASAAGLRMSAMGPLADARLAEAKAAAVAAKVASAAAKAASAAAKSASVAARAGRAGTDRAPRAGASVLRG